jgi:hypothetical protein
MNVIKAMKLWIKVLEDAKHHMSAMGAPIADVLDAIDQVNKAIAELEKQEPVAEKVYDPEDDTAYIQYFIPHELIPVGTEFYTHPQPKREPLTFAQLCETETKATMPDGEISLIRFARAIEAAHGIKGEA